jgi:aryl-alcohol dehydrogenase-like predicted oxidoreductase
MKQRRFGRVGGTVSEIGHGLWGMGGWTGSDDAESSAALDTAVSLGCTFFDTALAYGNGRSERLLGALIRRHTGTRLFIATKVPPKNWVWPGRGSTPVAEVFPYEHIIESTRTSLHNLGVESVDLQQLHVWDDAWTPDEGWQRAAETLKREGLVRAFGISVNRWEPANVLRALETGLVDSVQVVYNIFDQSPEDSLFPACRTHDVAVIARVPFDEGSLTGTLRPGATWPEGDWRNLYFAPPQLDETLRRVAPLEALAAHHGTSLPDLALRFILADPTVTTVIPGMRRPTHVKANLLASGRPLENDVRDALRQHRWDREPNATP